MSELKLHAWPIGDVKPYEANTKTHPKEQIDKIVASIQRFGFDQPIVVDANGVIIKGHGRRLAAIQMNLKKVPVVVRDDLSRDEVRAARIADNQVAKSDDDIDALASEISALDMAGFDLSSLGFEQSELDDIIGNIDLGDLSGPKAPNSEADKNVKEQDYKQKFELVVECSGEEQQEALYEEMAERGHTCRTLTI